MKKIIVFIGINLYVACGLFAAEAGAGAPLRLRGALDAVPPTASVFTEVTPDKTPGLAGTAAGARPLQTPAYDPKRLAECSILAANVKLDDPRLTTTSEGLMRNHASATNAKVHLTYKHWYKDREREDVLNVDALQTETFKFTKNPAYDLVAVAVEPSSGQKLVLNDAQKTLLQKQHAYLSFTQDLRTPHHTLVCSIQLLNKLGNTR